MIGEIARRQLCRHRDDRADGQSEAVLDKPDTPSLLQKQEQRRQYQRMEMADEMRRRDQPDRLIFAPSLNASSNRYLRRHAAFLLLPRHACQHSRPPDCPPIDTYYPPPPGGGGERAGGGGPTNRLAGPAHL